MNLTNGSANFFSEIESNCCLDLCLQSRVDVVSQIKRYLLETPGKPGLIVVFNSAQKCSLDDERTLSSGENVRCQVAKMNLRSFSSRTSRNRAQSDDFLSRVSHESAQNANAAQSVDRAG